jgi:CubicO group peptidase (beta-lactamase class C family)
LSTVEALFRRQLERGAFPGGQLVVRARGTELLNLAIGVARTDGAIPVTPATPFQVMSASKPVIALAVAVLEDRGLLDVSRPVAHYVPEFGQADKSEITVLDVLTHRAGVLVSTLWDASDLWPDWQRVQEEIWRTVPRYPRGTLAYHPREFGWILAEVVRRISGQSLPEFVAEVIPDVGLTLRFQVDPDEVRQVAHSYWQGRAGYRLGGEDLATRFEEVNNGPQTLTSLVPGASMLTTASALAQFYEMIVRGGVASSGERLIRAETLDAYLRRAVAGRDRTSGNFVVLGRGFMRGWRGPHVYGWWGTQDCVGHAGGFSTVAYSDLHTRLAVAIVTNGNRGFGDLLRRFAPLGSAIRREFAR